MAHEHFYVKRSERESLVQPELIYTGLLEDAPNWFNIQHSHDFCEILYVAGGAGEAILEGKKFRLAPGDLVVVNPGTLHEERSDAKAPLRLIFLAIRDFAVPGLPAGCFPVGNTGIKWIFIYGSFCRRPPARSNFIRRFPRGWCRRCWFW